MKIVNKSPIILNVNFEVSFKWAVHYIFFFFLANELFPVKFLWFLFFDQAFKATLSSLNQTFQN